jgi:hypothetical protein
MPDDDDVHVDVESYGCFCGLGKFFAALFQSLLYEACGRTVNPVFGAVGLLWAGNWQVCQAAVETVLKGGSLKPPSPSALHSPNFSSLPPEPLLHFQSGVEKSGLTKANNREAFPPSPLCPPLETAPEIFKVKLGMGMTFGHQEKVQKASGYEQQRDYSSGLAVESRDCKEAARQQQQHQQQQQEWQQQVKRAIRDVTPVASRWPDSSPGSTLQQMPGVGKREREVQQANNTNNFGVQVLAPVPRRVKPCSGGSGGYGMHDPMAKESCFYDHDHETVVGSNEQLDLGLTLKVKDTNKGVGGPKRVSSPSCDSVNSEGSVTSLDTTPHPVVQPLPPPGLTLQMSAMDHMHMPRKLLPLLL